MAFQHELPVAADSPGDGLFQQGHAALHHAHPVAGYFTTARLASNRISWVCSDICNQCGALLNTRNQRQVDGERRLFQEMVWLALNLC